MIVGGLSAVHQFCRIGRGAMIGGMTGVVADVIPYGMVVGERGHLGGLNLVGLKRRGAERAEIHGCAPPMPRSSGQGGHAPGPRRRRGRRPGGQPPRQEVAAFFAADSSRSFTTPKD